MIKKFILIIFFFATCIATVNAQHYVGVKNAIGITNLDSNPNLRTKSLTYNFNPGIVYQYEHKKYAAIQVEANLIQKGYNDTINMVQRTISSFELPVLAQGGYRFGIFRPYATGGFFIGRINKIEEERKSGTTDYEFEKNDRRFEYGIIGGAGLGISFSRFELQGEWRYQYAFSFLRKPHIDGVSQYLSTTQMMISVNLFYRLGK